MKDRLRFLIFLSMLIMSMSSYATADLERGLKDIFKLDMSADEVVDSAYNFIMATYIQAGVDSAGYARCENLFRERLVPFAEKNNCSAAEMAWLYDEIGKMSNRQGRSHIDKTRKTFKTALNYAREAKDHYQEGLIFEHKSLAETNYGDLAEGFRLAEEAIKAYSKSEKNAEQRIARCHYTQAVTYLHIMDLPGMRKVIANLEKFAKTVSEENRAFVLYNLYSVQEAYYGTLIQSNPNQDIKALNDTLNRVSLASVHLADENYDKWKGTSMDPTWNYYNRASFFINLSDKPNIDSVEYYINKMLGVDRTGKGNYEIEALISASSLRAEMWMKHGNYPKAKDILLSTIKELDATEGVNNVLFDKIEIYRNLEEIAKQSGHYDEALLFADEVSKIEKQRFSDEKANAIKEFEVKYQTQETQLALAKSEAERRRTLLWLVVVGALFVIAIAGFLIYAGRQHRLRLQKEMEFANLREDIGRQLTQQYVEGLENERQRMSRELHDGVCNDLLAIQMNITGGAPIEKTASLIDSCRESVRRISHELMPPEFAYASIDEVIRFFIGKQAGANGGKINFSYRSELNGSRNWQDVPDAVALEIYRIVQEAVGNAVKHSGATEIEVSLKLEDTAVTAEIMDNGTYKSSGRKGLGLESIQRRAKAINGTVKISTSEEGGTTVSLIATI